MVTMIKQIIKTEIKVKNNLVGVIRVGNVDYISIAKKILKDS
jgi:hypothetical protein